MLELNPKVSKRKVRGQAGKDRDSFSSIPGSLVDNWEVFLILITVLHRFIHRNITSYTARRFLI
jgi:hypothetical protein